MKRLLSLLLVGALSAGCIVGNSSTSTTAAVDTVAVPTSATKQVVTTIYFGLGIGDKGDVIPPAAWEEFVRKDIADALPAGFTIIDATGRWKDNDSVVREPSRMLIVIHDGSPLMSRKLDQLRATYKSRFKQESVLRVDTPASLVSF
jgi:hypothetical protein